MSKINETAEGKNINFLEALAGIVVIMSWEEIIKSEIFTLYIDSAIVHIIIENNTNKAISLVLLMILYEQQKICNCELIKTEVNFLVDALTRITLFYKFNTQFPVKRKINIETLLRKIDTKSKKWSDFLHNNFFREMFTKKSDTEIDSETCLPQHFI